MSLDGCWLHVPQHYPAPKTPSTLPESLANFLPLAVIFFFFGVGGGQGELEEEIMGKLDQSLGWKPFPTGNC